MDARTLRNGLRDVIKTFNRPKPDLGWAALRRGGPIASSQRQGGVRVSPLAWPKCCCRAGLSGRSVTDPHPQERAMIRRQMNRRQMLLAGMAGLGSLVAIRGLRASPGSSAAAAGAGTLTIGGDLTGKRMGLGGGRGGGGGAGGEGAGAG